MAWAVANHADQAVSVAALLSPRLLELGERVSGAIQQDDAHNPTSAAAPAATRRLLLPPCTTFRTLCVPAAELIRRRPTFQQNHLEDGTPCCPRIQLSAEQAAAPLPGLEQHKTVTWRVNGRDVEHLMICLAVSLTAVCHLGHDSPLSTPGAMREDQCR